MATDVDSLVISIKLQAEQANAGIDALSKKLDAFADQTQKDLGKALNPDIFASQLKKIESVVSTSANNISSIFTKVLGTLGVTLGLKFGVDFVKNLSKSGLNTQYISRATGTTTDQLQNVQNLFQTATGSKAGANQSLSSLYSKMTNLNANPEFSQAIRLLGNVSPRETGGGLKDTGKYLMQLLENASKISDPRIRINALQMAGLGDEAVAITSSRKNFEDYKAQAGKLPKQTTKEITDEAKVAQGLQQVDATFKKMGADYIDPLTKAITGLTTVMTGVLNFLSPALKTQEAVQKLTDTKSYSAKKGIGFTENLKKDWNYLENKVKSIFGSGDNEGEAWNKAKNAMSQVESSGGIQMERHGKGRDVSFGRYQMSLATAREMTNNPNLSENDLRANNYALADGLSEKYFKQLYKKNKGDYAKTLSQYNGGNRNATYVGKILQALPTNAHMMPNSKANPSNHTTNNTTSNQNSTVNVQNLNVHGVSNANQMAKDLHKMGATGYGFAGSSIA